MKKKIINIVKYLLFLSIGIFIFYYIYRERDPQKIWESIKGMKHYWLFASMGLGLMAHLSRAIRWKMLIAPLGYNPRTYNVFLSVLVLYFANLLIPRFGEVARCTVVSRTEKVPFTKLVGTVFIERIADTVMLMILAIGIFLFNFDDIKTMFLSENLLEEFQTKLNSYNLLLLLALALGAMLLLALVVMVILKNKKIKTKIAQLKGQFAEGIRSIANMKNKWYFIGHTCFIFLMWLIMLYVVFLAYEPTSHLTIRIGMVTFLMGGLAMLAPVQGGIGPWHFMVILSLMHFKIGEEEAETFALVAHATTNLVYFIFGGIALMMVLFIKDQRKSDAPPHI